MKKRILVVDDEKNIRWILQRFLRKNGFEAETAENGLEALQKITAFKPNLIITDIRMPIMDGIQLIQKIKEINPNLPIIVMSGYMDDKQERFFEKNKIIFFKKPFPSLLQFITTVREIFIKS